MPLLPPRTGYSFDLSDEDAIDLGRRSIYAAGHRDVRVFLSLTAVLWLASFCDFAYGARGLQPSDDSHRTGLLRQHDQPLQ